MKRYHKPKRGKYEPTGEKQNEVYIVYRTTPDIFDVKTITPTKCAINGGEYLQMASIDPATNNYGIRIERRYLDKPLIIPLLFTKLDLRPTKEYENVYLNLTLFLDKYYSLFRECHIILFERQITDNYSMIRMSQHTLSYFITKLTKSPIESKTNIKLNILNYEPKTVIIEINSQVKGRQLGGAVGLKKNQLKKWAVDKAIELLTIRGDTFSLEIIRRLKKKDDVADTVVQLEALCSLLKLPVTQQPVINLSSQDKKLKPILNIKPQTVEALSVNPILNIKVDKPEVESNASTPTPNKIKINIKS
jgi:hypothetical protein